MARLDSNEQILELHIQCGVCNKKFDALMTSGQKNLTITCPFCSNLALAIIEDFSLRPAEGGMRKAKDSQDKKRKYRI